LDVESEEDEEDGKKKERRTEEKRLTEIEMSFPSLNFEGTFLMANVNKIPTIITRA